ncbi:TetR family transcriptional regulator [Azonexus fungiphilus]|uniref:TetR family transcriptional regulator n=1 Tax=Azonexus fungiphilus TaxID=146940 RepID=A0A495WHI7_9RHOO|nr:TetR/AcrR family transcriptional regulator [Azonexus fungiphilus]RKT60829.1 TetR family transcriptional regulator [Azonexus fungiphilus]HOI53174.1 TetR/AcrR family transcriptional regulator [Azonexus sp.]
MRTKSEAKRQGILDAASEVFRVTGFEGASMSDICAKAGYSRATLYSYFPSKEALFLEVMLSGSHAQAEVITRALDPETPSIEEALVHFGKDLLAFIYSPEILALRRLAIAEATRSDFGEMFYARSRKQGEVIISAFLKQAMGAGKLRQADPSIAMAHLSGLLESELEEMFYHTEIKPLDPLRLDRIARSAIGVFMAAYGPRS